MRIEEASWIGQGISRFLPAAPTGAAPIALNLGSGTRHSREIAKPYIDRLTLAPLREAGYRVLNSDLFEGEGIDLVGDLFDPDFQRRLQELQPKFILFCNILEHLPTKLRTRVPEVLGTVLAPGGLLFLTVPHSYPYHADPIDTMYRPTPEQVASLFPMLDVVEGRLVQSSDYRSEFMQGSLSKRLRKLLRMLFPFVRPKRWLSHAHRFLWLYRPYLHSCVMLRKPTP